MWNASRNTRVMSSACWMRYECLTIGMKMPVVSASWKASVPIRCVGTWPVTTTIGVESRNASATGVTRFVAPGPEVAHATPTLPVARA